MHYIERNKTRDFANLFIDTELMEIRLVFSLFVRLGGSILNILTFLNVAVNHGIYFTLLLLLLKFYFLTHYTVKISSACRVHYNAFESFFRKIFRCIFPGRDFLKYIAHFCTILFYDL